MYVRIYSTSRKWSTVRCIAWPVQSLGTLPYGLILLSQPSYSILNARDCSEPEETIIHTSHKGVCISLTGNVVLNTICCPLVHSEEGPHSCWCFSLLYMCDAASNINFGHCPFALYFLYLRKFSLVTLSDHMPHHLTIYTMTRYHVTSGCVHIYKRPALEG